MGNRFLDAVNLIQENLLKFNPYHAKDGRFSSGDGANSYSWQDGRRYTRAEEDEAFAVQDIKSLIEKGIHSPDDAVAIGTKIQELMGEEYQAYVTKFANKTTELEQQIRALRPELERKAANAHSSLTQKELDDAIRDYNGVVNKRLSKLQEASGKMQEMVTQKLSLFTPMGGKITSMDSSSDAKAMSALAAGMALYPKSWGVLNSKAPLHTELTKRGYTMGTTVIALSGSTQASRVQTSVHEFAHRSAYLSANVQNMEQKYYLERTKGSPTVSMRSATGDNYNFRPDEVTKVDSFASAYSGKLYANSSKKSGLEATEILSTGIESLYFPTTASLDKNLGAFSLGMLAGGKV